MSMIDEKKKTLAEFLGCSENDIVYQSDWDAFEVNDEEYRVLDEEEARQAMYEDQESFIDDLGIGGYTQEFRDWIVENALDQSWFEEALQESAEYYYNDIADEDSDEYENQLIAEAVELGVIPESDIDENGKYIGDFDIYNIASMCAATQMEKIYNYVEEFASEYGWEEVKNVVEQHPNIIDIDAITDEIIDWDGYGVLATYDGKDYEENRFHILRIN